MDKSVDCNSGRTMSQCSEVNKDHDSLGEKNAMQGKDITLMNFEDLQAHFASSGEEFSSKMEENFKCYVFIAVSAGTQDLDEVLKNMAIFAGYQMYKTVGCSQRIYHLYVKYEEECIAMSARDFFRMKGLCAEVVYDMLHLWYAFETAFEQIKCQTIGWLTVSDGGYPTSRSADAVLSKYGNPEIKVVVDKSVKVSFGSIAEAFGASIALGQWNCNNSPAYPMYYSVKIELSDHCSRIMRMCNTTSVANDFDYFVQSDPNLTAKVIDSKLFQPYDAEPDQKAKVFRSRYTKRPYYAGQRNRNYNRISKRSNFENTSCHNQQNVWTQTA